MADLSLNLEIKGIGNTTMSMADAKKLYSELKVLFEEKVAYVPTYGWRWNYPWWGTMSNPHHDVWYSTDTKTARQPRKGIFDAPSSYSVSI